jgi:hypothetical protein
VSNAESHRSAAALVGCSASARPSAFKAALRPAWVSTAARSANTNCRPHARAAALEAQNASSLSSMMSRSLFGTNCISLTTRGNTSCAKNFADAIFPS